MARPLDSDLELQALQEEMQAVMQALNMLHHPVNPGSPEQIEALEEQVKELKRAIIERRAALSSERGRPVQLNRRRAHA